MVPTSSVLPSVENQTPANAAAVGLSPDRNTVRIEDGSESKSNTLVLARAVAAVRRHAARVWISIFRITEWVTVGLVF